MPDTTFHPLTPDRWDDLVALFETDSMTRNCWCMVTRLTGAELREFKGPQRRQMFQQLVKQGKKDGVAPGVLAYQDGKPIGWLAVAPRSLTPDWNKGRKSSAVEAEADATDPACWGASCFFVRSGHRKQGLTADMLDAGIALARKGGASRLEACPMNDEDKRSPVGMCVGPKRIFERAGFETVLERKAGRPLMRLGLKAKRAKAAPNAKTAAKPVEAKSKPSGSRKSAR
jgi:GNAT superfamily N-acetyltransferase